MKVRNWIWVVMEWEVVPYWCPPIFYYEMFPTYQKNERTV